VNQMVAMAMLWSSLLRSTKTALILSVLTIIFGALMGITLIDNLLSTSSTPHGTLLTISLVPPFLLYRMLWEFAQAAFQAGYQGTQGMQWSDLTEDPRNDVDELFLVMWLEWAMFLALALYFDQVLDTGNGIPRHPLFCIPRFIMKSLTGHDHEAALEALEAPEILDPSLTDVVEEAARVCAMVGPESPWATTGDGAGLDPVIVDRVRKVYPAANGNPPKVANRGVSFSVRRGECLGLLGPNGAGKSTCIHMLCGFMGPTSGQAMVHGLSILTEMKKIFTLMGVCPQDNHLWDTLTAREHLLFYGRLKNIPTPELPAAIEKALAAVNLLLNIDQQAGTYSGGMKRRLSVAISLIGSPMVCYLDEPSTGLDPASRRLLWQCVKQAKRDTSILLTTHSMEEAEALCDRLGIFIDGGLHCLAPPKVLTERYGGTFVLTIAAPMEQSDAVAAMVKAMAPGSKCTHSVSGTQTFEFPRSDVTLSQVFNVMIFQRDKYQIRDWGIANTTLEEAFIKISDGAIGT